MFRCMLGNSAHSDCTSHPSLTGNLSSLGPSSTSQLPDLAMEERVLEVTVLAETELAETELALAHRCL